MADEEVEYPRLSEAGDPKEIKEKLLKTGILKRWAEERTQLEKKPSIVERVNEKLGRLGKEANARMQIVKAIKKDIRATEMGYPMLRLDTPLVEDNWGLYGNPEEKALGPKSMVRWLLSQGGPHVTEHSMPWFGGTKSMSYSGFVELSRKDTLTGEDYTLRIGSAMEGDNHVFFAEEVRPNGEVISSAKILERGYSPSFSDSTRYELILNFTGGRYEYRGAEISLKSGKLPYATVKTFELLVYSAVNEVTKRQEKKK